MSQDNAPAPYARRSRFAPRWPRKLLGTLLTIAVTLLGLLFVTFMIGRVIPIDPVLAVIGERATQAQYDAVFLELGLDKPLLQQFLIYVNDVLHGDFGRSIRTGQLVSEDIKRVFPATLELATLGTLIGVFIGVPLGVLAAVYRDSWIDQLARLVGLVGYSMPIFWMGLVGLLVFYGILGWVEGPGRLGVFYQGIVPERTGLLLVDALIAGDWTVFKDAFSHIVLPASLLGYFSLAYISRMTRSFMLEQLSAEYITTARVKGLSEWDVVWRHAFRNIRIQLVTVIALAYANLLEGSVLTEIIFAWPGIGQYITTSLLANDMNSVLGGTVVIGSIFVGLNIFSDLLYRFFDPRAK
ncbi:peptide ABC transporter permease [Salipiger aestuarii]|uniref:Peptide/nickel transport system permease protein n=1 Tax=Salipiger aestuarii TaxID=568098 RepID=A0A327YRV3_9RHOB|nr:ABC transporter permease [Salipiger aestuarii]KAB2543600.1 peptide ABC transporter permease [Salipiger aestuarii]RAK22827.1 peptide/nickel transport system permease protein [Salipiger aestuarii]